MQNNDLLPSFVFCYYCCSVALFVCYILKENCICRLICTCVIDLILKVSQPFQLFFWAQYIPPSFQFKTGSVGNLGILRRYRRCVRLLRGNRQCHLCDRTGGRLSLREVKVGLSLLNRHPHLLRTPSLSVLF